MKRFLPFILIAISFIVASMINVYPLGFVLAGYRPMMLMLVLCFWAMYQLKLVGTGVAFVIGLAADLLFDTHLGHQAFCAVAMVFFIRVATIYTKRLTLMSSWLLASTALFLYTGVLWVLQSFGQNGMTDFGFGSFLTSMLIFPIVWWVLSYALQKIDPNGHLS